jgi:hypothetical protein
MAPRTQAWLDRIPRYKCHKVVGAVKIEAILRDASRAGATITPADHSIEPFFVDAEYIAKHLPHVGGYFVLYDDAYESFSPAQAFESGYARI